MATSSASRSLTGAARAHRFLALAILLGATVQFFLAGLATFGADADVWDGHAGFGSLLTLLGLAAVVLAFAARRSAVQPSAILFGALVLQHVLAIVGRDVEIVGALHPVNGLFILAAAMLAAAGRPFRRGAHTPAGA